MQIAARSARILSAQRRPKRSREGYTCPYTARKEWAADGMAKRMRPKMRPLRGSEMSPAAGGLVYSGRPCAPYLFSSVYPNSLHIRTDAASILYIIFFYNFCLGDYSIYKNTSPSLSALEIYSKILSCPFGRLNTTPCKARS